MTDATSLDRRRRGRVRTFLVRNVEKAVLQVMMSLVVVVLERRLRKVFHLNAGQRPGR